MMIDITDPLKVPFIFRNCELTIPANIELKEWLLIVLKECPDELKFLHKKSQEYKSFGGASSYTFPRWLKRLEKDLNNTQF